MLNLAGLRPARLGPGERTTRPRLLLLLAALPVFDRNLKNLAEKIRAGCLLAHVRGVAYHTRVEISLQNVHPFQFPGVPLVLAHNGDLARFAEMKPLLAAAHQAGVPAADPRHHRQRVGLRPDRLAARRPARATRAPTSSAAPSSARSTSSATRARSSASPSAPRSTSSSPTARQLAAVRYCFDFGCYPTEDAARLHEANLSYLALWYTAGRDYGLHDGEWKMTGGAENADSILVASEPLTRDTAAWVEVPEYSHAARDDPRRTGPRSRSATCWISSPTAADDLPAVAPSPARRLPLPRRAAAPG